MFRLSRFLMALLVAVIGLQGVAQAQFLTLDPRLTWQTLETEHFRVIYPEGLEEVARETAVYSEAAYVFWADELGHAPSFKINEVVADIGDLAAGAANPLARNTIQGTSDARSFNEWLNARTRSGLEQVVFHELGHVVDLSKVGGIPALLGNVFGAISAPNLNRPGPLIEGIPIYEEYARSGASRANDPREAMYLRALLLEDTFVPFDRLLNSGHSRKAFPSPYMLNHNYGAWMTRYLAEGYGREKIRELDEVTSEQLLPLLSAYTLNDFGGTLKQVTGDSPQAFYEGFEAWLSEQFRPQIERARAAGVTPSETISALPYWNNEPAVSPDGQWIAYYHYDPDRNAGIRLMRADGSEERFLISTPLELPFFRPPYWAASPTWSPDGRQLAYHKHELWNQYYTLGDIYVYDLDSQTQRRLTQGVRAFKPTWFPDGRRLLFARQSNHALNTDLMVLDLDSGQTSQLLTLPTGTLIDDFSISPDGAQIAVSIWERGFSDLYLMPSDGGTLTRITQDAATDDDPAWSPDGRYVLFSSDRDGINNLYAYRPGDGAFFQVSNVLTGAFAPDVSVEDQIVFVGYDTQGYNLQTMPYDPEQWIPVAFVQEPLPQAPEFPEVDYQITPYNPLDTALPTLWVPLPGIGGQLGALTFGNDAMFAHTYFLMGGVDMNEGTPFYALNYTTNALGLPLTLDLNGNGGHHTQALNVDLPLLTQLHATHTLNVGVQQAISADAPLARTTSAGWTWQADTYHDLFASQRTLTVSGALTWLEGAASPERRLELDWRETLRLPVESDQHLALKLAAGWSDGEPLALGGDSGRYLLRGYEGGAFSGQVALAASVEYRFLMLSIERGLGQWPLFLDDVSGSVFVDVGLAGETWDPQAPHLGIGAEVQTTWTLAYAASAALNVGVGYGLDDGTLQLIVRGGTAF